MKATELTLAVTPIGPGSNPGRPVSVNYVVE